MEYKLYLRGSGDRLMVVYLSIMTGDGQQRRRCEEFAIANPPTYPSQLSVYGQTFQWLHELLSGVQLERPMSGSGQLKVDDEILSFYTQLYTSTQAPVGNIAEDPRAMLYRHYTEDIPDVSVDEIRMAPNQLK